MALSIRRHQILEFVFEERADLNIDIAIGVGPKSLSVWRGNTRGNTCDATGLEIRQ